MRVIAGERRGLKLTAPEGVNTRPTSDRVKESLFSILSSRISFESLIVLDLCAGSGSLGIEALSRGAQSCIFVESNNLAKQQLNSNLLRSGFNAVSTVVSSDVIKFLQKSDLSCQCIELVFFDPPYLSELYLPVLELLDSSGILKENSIVVAECAKKNLLPDNISTLHKFERRIYGDTALEFYTVEGR